MHTALISWLDCRRIGAAAPVGGDQLRGQAEPVGKFLPQLGEMAGFHHEDAIPRRQRVDHCRLPGASAGCRIDDHRAGALEDRLQAGEDLLAKIPERRSAMIHSRMVHRPEDAIGNIGGPRNLQKMPAGGSCALHGYLLFICGDCSPLHSPEGKAIAIAQAGPGARGAGGRGAGARTRWHLVDSPKASPTACSRAGGNPGAAWQRLWVPPSAGTSDELSHISSCSRSGPRADPPP
jgi:hypothetical protein